MIPDGSGNFSRLMGMLSVKTIKDLVKGLGDMQWL